MPNGSVKFFNAAKGFGFITSDGSGKDIFVPSTSLLSSGISTLKPGQRVFFEEAPDGKGPKAVTLKLLPTLPKPNVEKAHPAPSLNAEAKPRLTFYHDHTSDWSLHALAAVRAAGYDPKIVEYLLTPPAKDELKTLSRLLAVSDQNLVRKYDPLFLELRLDDRFIGDSEFWEAVVENPALINGPLIAMAAKASLCHSEDEIESFFSASQTRGAQPASKPKGLSERSLRILAGETIPHPAKPLQLIPKSENPRKIGTVAKDQAIQTSGSAARAKGEVSKKVKSKVSAKQVIKKTGVKSKPKAKPFAKSNPKSKKTVRRARK